MDLLRREHTASINEVVEAEREWIKKRRQNAGKEKGSPEKDAMGVALSGGGIRSATFNLGLLQALEGSNILKRIDYLSTVSGGGYIGSTFTWLKSIRPDIFPFGTKRKHHSGVGGKVLYWLRCRGRYLIPGDGLNEWALAAAILTGTLVNLVVLVPVFLLTFWGLSQEIFKFSSPLEALASSLSLPLTYSDGFAVVFGLGLLALAFFLLFVFIFAIETSISHLRSFVKQRKMRSKAGQALMWSVVLIVIGTLPLGHAYAVAHLGNLIEEAMSAISLSGLMALFAGWRGKKGGNEIRGWRSFVLSLGLTLLIYGLFLWFYHLVNCQVDWPGSLGFWIMIGASVFFAIFTDINHVSMHRYYRNRLMEAYMPHEIEVDLPSEERPVAEIENKDYPGVSQREADQFLLGKIPITDAPYHIINTNVQLIGSSDPRLCGRGGDNFILSPKHCGAESLGYAPTETYMKGIVNLATAMAISGAAVNPNTYATRSRPLSFIMTLLNVRLGYWIQNPRYCSRLYRTVSRPWWYTYMFREMMGKGLNENSRQVHLSDGGHFENLGLYELVRRRCSYIVISDASADPDWTFSDLAKAIELVRVDFGAKVTLDTSEILPDKESKRSPKAFAFGDLEYDDGTTGKILYIKTTVIDKLSEDIYGYHRLNPKFPDETTIDQFFDEQQFEAYRELGFLLGRRACEGMKTAGWNVLFETEG